MASEPNNDNWDLPQRVATVPAPVAGQPDQVVDRYVNMLKKATRIDVEAAVTKGPTAAAAAATQVLSTLRGGWASIKSLWTKTPEDRAFDIYSEIVHGRAPLSFKEKITKTFFEILSVGKCSLTRLTRFAGMAIGILSPQKLAEMLGQTRVTLIDSRYGPIRPNAKMPRGELGGRMYLVSRYAPIASPNFGKKLADLATKTGVDPTDKRFGPLLAEIIRKKTGMVLSPAAAERVASGELSMNTGRVSASRYNVIGTPKMFSTARSELNSLAGELGVKPVNIFKNPAMAKVLAQRLLGRGKKLTPTEAAELTGKLAANFSSPNRVTRLRYNKFSVKIPTRIASTINKLSATLQKIPEKFSEIDIQTVLLKLKADGVSATKQMVQDVIRKMKGNTSRIGMNRYGPASAASQAQTANEEQKLAKHKREMSALIDALTGVSTLPRNGRFIVNNRPVQVSAAEFKKALEISKAVQEALKGRLVDGAPNAAINVVRRYRMEANALKRDLQALGVNTVNNFTPTNTLIGVRNAHLNSLSNSAKKKLMELIRSRVTRDAAALRKLTHNTSTLQSWTRYFTAHTSDPGRTEFVSALRNGIRQAAANSNSAAAMRRLANLQAATQGLGVNTNILAARRSIANKMRREQNEKRRIQNANRASRGLAPLPYNRGIPYNPSQPAPRGYGNLQPIFEAPPNRPQFGAVPRSMPQIPPMPIMANTPLPPIENILPPGEKNAVLNAGGANKALNLVENAGGVTNVVKTANILKSVGNNPNAAVAAGANAKNVKIVLQLGGANNALKVANAVPKLKKRRRSKKAKKAPKPKSPRVKEMKKLIEYLGSKENLVKKLPNKENREKKLTKKQIVSKITRHLLRKN